MTVTNRTSRLAIAGRRVVESLRQSRGWEVWVPPGDYHLPFGSARARAEVSKWLCPI